MKYKKEKNVIEKKETDLEEAKQAMDFLKKNISLPNFFGYEENKMEELEKIITSENKEDIKQKKKLLDEILSIHGLECGLWVMGIDQNEYSPALAKMKQMITEEYSCKSASEFMLVDRIVSSYWRAMKYEKIINSLIGEEDDKLSFTQLKINILKEANRGIEVANRQFNNNIILLKELKQPNLNIKVKADNAYFAQNQQINNKTDGESLKPNDLGKNI